MNRETLAILVTHTGEIINTCIPSGYKLHEFPSFPYPVWLPDGNTIAVIANYRSESKEYDAVLIDLEIFTAFTIGTNQMPIDWVAMP